MEQPLVSVIVPIYNAASTLRACVESILRQSYRNIEVLLVNDGSRDDSLALCRSFAAFDDRIRVLDRAQSGVSACRNAALDIARGDYIQFVDADDYLVERATELLTGLAERTGCDLVIGDFYRVVQQRMAVKGNIRTDQLLDRRAFAAYLMENPANFYYGVLWNKLYRRSLIQAHQIRCNPDLTCGEDALFNFDYIHYATSFCALRVPVYYYVKRKGSLCHIHANPVDMIEMKKQLFESYKAIFESVDLYETHRMKIFSFFVEMAKDGTILSPDTLRFQHLDRSE